MKLEFIQKPQSLKNQGARFWIDRAYGDIMLKSASKKRMKHLKQVLENEDSSFSNNEDQSLGSLSISGTSLDEDQEIVNLTGLNTVPAIIINNEYYIPGRDFQNAQHILNIIETYSDNSFDLSKRTLERIKTLNYNINIAFGRLDQLLRKIETKINTDEHKSTD